MDKKFTTAQLEVKEDGDQGLVRAVFATLNVVDKDGDVTLPGAFGQQQVKLAAWGHNWGDLPVGRGSIKEAGEEAIFDGRFFLDTNAGREHFQTVKNLADLQEWSYGFRVLDSSDGEFEGRDVRFLKSMEVFEVSPVMVGAGEGTRTVAIKGEDPAATPPAEIAEHTDNVMKEVQALIERYQSVTGELETEGRSLSGAKRERLISLADLVRSVGDEIKGLLTQTEQPAPEKVLALHSEYQRLVARINRLA